MNNNGRELILYNQSNSAVNIKLPSVKEVIERIDSRIKGLKESLEEAKNPDEVILFEDEMKKYQHLNYEIKNIFSQNNNSDHQLLTNLHSSLELRLSSWTRDISHRLQEHQLISKDELKGYNEATHKYNLFCNLIESLAS